MEAHPGNQNHNMHHHNHNHRSPNTSSSTTKEDTWISVAEVSVSNHDTSSYFEDDELSAGLGPYPSSVDSKSSVGSPHLSHHKVAPLAQQETRWLSKARLVLIVILFVATSQTAFCTYIFTRNVERNDIATKVSIRPTRSVPHKNHRIRYSAPDLVHYIVV